MAAVGSCVSGTGSTESVAAAAAASKNVTSFQRKGPRAGGTDSGGSRLVSIAGTRPSVRNGQLLVSTGLPALDQLLGGGLAVGTVLLIEEDKYNVYSPLLFKYFLVEGIVSGHTLLVASAKENPADILQELPAPLLDESCRKDFDEDVGDHKAPDANVKMKIAWRYQLLPKMEKKQKNILRIGIQSLGSPLWGDDVCCTEHCDSSHSLTKFLYILRGLLRASLSACIITMPTHLIQNKAITARITNLSDTVVHLESFFGSERETNPLYKDYHGLIHIRQIPRLNNLICDVSDVKDLAFKLKRKLFTIERLHLPPDLSDTVSRSSKQDLAESARLLGPGCGMMAGGKKHLDF
ncbi:elongator complex protein 4 isoform X2 [Desmodus rotundus]|uniref:elongator complex protein 4 isoform X2 n=1 Tax=Desmodus rotundus TaxID=9430 RepID=UPI00238106C7|nr:elongator complex protein 4 isoform X2 [Desmodus rotundus]